MRTPPRILVVDDEPANLDIFQTRLSVHGYEVITARDGEEALRVAEAGRPDLILLDVNMPLMDGIEVCRRLKSDPSFSFTPIVMVTALADSKDVVRGLEVGADEYLTKPVDQAALVARVKSMLRIKELHDRVQEQAAQLAEWNRSLEQRVNDQLGELERIGSLKRFLSPQLAESIVSEGGEGILESHRREITVLFCDLRGFTGFSESVAPEELMEVLADYHAAMGKLIFRFEGTLEHFSGDGIMVFFNDPHPIPDHAARAVRLAIAMREQMEPLRERWKKRGHALGFSVGVALGYATLGMIGCEGRIDYGAIGPVTNLASHLCDEAVNGQILISQRVMAEVENAVDAEPLGEIALKGFSKPMLTFNVIGVKESI